MKNFESGRPISSEEIHEKEKEKKFFPRETSSTRRWTTVEKSKNIEKSLVVFVSTRAEETKRGPRDNKKGVGRVSADALLVKPGDSLVI